MITEARYELTLKIYEELRKEIVSSQTIRTQVIGFKIAFASAALGLVFANFDKIPNIIFFIPAFASVFFDLLIVSYGFSIKRMGTYTRKVIEPVLREYTEWPDIDDCPFWEEEMRKKSSRRGSLTFIGNIGFTMLISAPAILLSLSTIQIRNSILDIITIITIIIFFIFLIYDIIAFTYPTKIIEDSKKFNCLEKKID